MKDNTKCTYCNRGFHTQISCMNNTIDLMAHLLEKNTIPLPEGARRKEVGLIFEEKEKWHALMVGI